MSKGNHYDMKKPLHSFFIAVKALCPLFNILATTFI